MPSGYSFVGYQVDGDSAGENEDGWLEVYVEGSVTVTVCNEKDDGPPPDDDDTELIIEKEVINRSGDGTEFDIEVARYVEQKGDDYLDVFDSFNLSENDGQYVIDLDDSELGPGTYFVREVRDDMPSRYSFVGYKIDGSTADENEDGWLEVGVEEEDSVVVTVENRRRSSGGNGGDDDDDNGDDDDEFETFTEPETEEPEVFIPEPVIEEVPQETEPVLVGPLPKTGRDAFPFLVLGFLVTVGGAVVVFRRI